MNKSQATVEGSATASVLRIALENLATLKLNAAAKAHLDCLPLVFEDNPEEYFEFISKYGTHFCASGDFGGLIKQVSSSKFPFCGKSSLEFTSGGYFKNYLEKYGVKVDNYSYSEEFLSQSTVERDFYGGDKNLILNSFNATVWNPMIAAKPWLLKCNLVPISRLIDQSDKQLSMDLAVQAYLNKIYLGEVVETLNGFLNDYPVNTFEIHSMTNQANKLQLNSVPQADSVTELSIRMAPGKFWENVSLCFHSDCADNGSPPCAKMNSFTSVYNDINNKPDRECSLSWSILSTTHHEEWFSSVEICFRYSDYRWSYSKKRRDCKPDPTVECVSVNRDMNDIIDRRYKWCLSWMLKVPPLSPPWMLRSKLCLRHKSNHNHCSSLANWNSASVVCIRQ